MKQILGGRVTNDIRSGVPVEEPKIQRNFPTGD